MIKYTNQITDDTLKQKISRITVREGGAFQSMVFQDQMASDDANERIGQNWVAAQKDSDSDRWVLTKYTIESAAPYAYAQGNEAQNAILRQKQILSGCYFDVLYGCAAFETASKDMVDWLVVKGREDLAQTHYKKFAEDRGIPFDVSTDMPVPAADGILLSDHATLSLEGADIIARSAGNLVKADDLNLGTAESILGAPVKGGALVPFEGMSAKELACKNVAANIQQQHSRAKTQQEIVRAHDQQKNNLQRLQDDFSALAERPLQKFENPLRLRTLGSGLCLVPTASLVAMAGTSHSLFWITAGAVAYLVGGFISGIVWGCDIQGHEEPSNDDLKVTYGIDFARDSIAFITRGSRSVARNMMGDQFLRSKFKSAVRKQRQHVAGLEEGEYKEGQQHILNMAETCFYALRARQAFNHAAQSKGLFGGNIRRAQKAVDQFWEVAEANGLAQDQVAVIAQEIQTNPAVPGDFDPQASAMIARFEGYMNDMNAGAMQEKEQQLKQLPAPSLNHIV
jgi:hypothetical protein